MANAQEKRVINGTSSMNQLAPFKYPWAWQAYLDSIDNNWTPREVAMGKDKADFELTLLPNEIHTFTTVLAYLSTADIMAMRNVSIAVMEKITAPEIQQYLGRQTFEETLHTWTYQHCIEVLGLDQTEIYSRYERIPEIRAKILLSSSYTRRIIESDLTTREGIEEFIHCYYFFSAIFEGCWFYHGFTPIFALQRRNLMKGAGEQFQYILRDEVVHSKTGLNIIREICREEGVSLNQDRLNSMWMEAEAVELAYINHAIPQPFLGYNVEMHMGQFRFIANRRMKQMGMAEVYPGSECTVLWLDEQANINKEGNFFEVKVKEYRAGGALDFGGEGSAPKFEGDMEW